MAGLPFEEPADVWCWLCSSQGKPPAESYCAECRPLRIRYFEELSRRSLGYRARTAIRKLAGFDAGRGILETLAFGATLAVAWLLLALGP
jgi:hypothetical protein